VKGARVFFQTMETGKPVNKEESGKPSDENPENGYYIFRMTITVNGKKIRRKNGRPFKILIKN
jgi:hypothetical protein